MNASQRLSVSHAPAQPHVDSLLRLAVEARDATIRELLAENTDLRAQAARFQLAIDSLSAGVSFFDRDDQLIACNRPYAELYRLTPDQVTPGATLREIVERRFAAGVWCAGAEDYLARCAAIKEGRELPTWVSTLADGRSIRISYRPMADGGWVIIHEDVTQAAERRLPIEETDSLQSLIDAVPDTLWVKDTQSRFVVANVATARRLCRATPQELIGKTDFDFLPRELAQKYVGATSATSLKPGTR